MTAVFEEIVEQATATGRQPDQATMRRALVSALRSGQYKQCRNALCKVDSETGERGYCCLGVACHVAMLAGFDVVEKRSDPYAGEIEYNGFGSLPPTAVLDAYGFKYRNGGRDDGPSLATLNDSVRLNFNQIADLIESNPPGLFVTTE